MPSINFKDHAEAVEYFKNITSSIAEHCSSQTIYTLKFNTTETLHEIASNLTSIYDYYNSNLCTKMYRRSGIEMSEYACSENEIDNFYLEFTNAARTEITGNLADHCIES